MLDLCCCLDFCPCCCIVPPIFDLVNFSMNCINTDKESEQKFKAIEKWEQIYLGLEGYAYTVRHTNQTAWNDSYENAVLFKNHTANENIKDNIRRGINDANQNGMICDHFLQASLIHPRQIENSGELWDPERVEVEIPLMEGKKILSRTNIKC